MLTIPGCPGLSRGGLHRESLQYNILFQPHPEKGNCRTNGFYLVSERARLQASRV